MPVFNEYLYKPLSGENGVRLVILDPATDLEAPLSCSIVQHYRYNRSVKYAAVSYPWGEQEVSPRNCLEIRDDGDISYIRITAAVNNLLCNLRLPDGPRCLWIDAISLNQEDEIEKAHQIPAMGSIYEEAHEVLIWLGPDTHMTSKLFLLFHKVIGLRQEASSSKIASQISALMRRYLADDGRSGLGFLAEFFEQPWFSRRWVIQEASLARKATVRCGSHSIPLSVLVSAATRFQNLDMSWYTLKVVASLRRPPSTKFGLLELLWDFHEAGCRDPKDRIAAFLGMVSNDNQFRMDYTARWTDMYRQVASSMFDRNGNNIRLQLLLHLFEFGALDESTDPDFPSWVPDWSKTRRRSLPYHSLIRNVDTKEQYPRTVRGFKRVSLTFDRQTLRIQWPSRIGGPQDRQVMRVDHFDESVESEDQMADRTLTLLRTIFPSDSDSVDHILALSSLLETITEFRYTRNERDRHRLWAPSFDEYLRAISLRLPASPITEGLNYLRDLDSILQEFWLFELPQCGPASASGRCFGISSQQIQTGDIVIPLWNMKGRRDRSMEDPTQPKSSNLATALIVRPDGQQQRREKKKRADDEEQVPRGRIVGPAVCVITKGFWSDEQGRLISTEADSSSVEEEQCSIYLM